MTKWMILAALFVSATAHAEPDAITTAIANMPPMYIEADWMPVSINGDGRAMTAATVESGQRLKDIQRSDNGSVSVWLHEELVFGSSDEFLNLFGPAKPGTVFGGRVGPELRGCIVRDVMCVVGGLDFGLQHDSFDAMMDQSSGITGLFAVRAGLDLGHKIRVRPSVEMPFGSEGPGLAYKLGLAYQW